jgi:hypothetical protein
MPAPSPLEDFLLASLDSDPGAMRASLDAAADLAGLAACLDSVLLPAMREIGRGWSAGRVSIAVEVLATETARGWLESLDSLAPPPLSNPPVLLACGPGDRHTLGLEAFATLLRRQRRICRVIGSRTSADKLKTAVLAGQPDAIVLVAQLRSSRRGSTRLLRSARHLGPGLFYAGAAFDTARQRRNVPGTYLGTNFGQACTQVVAALETIGGGVPAADSAVDLAAAEADAGNDAVS